MSLLENSDHYWLSGFYRLKGELLLNKHPAVAALASRLDLPSEPIQEAETCLLKAVEIARRQGAKSLELKAATSLAHLWQQQGKSQDALQVLDFIYSWFTEGFDTPDLIKAKMLLEDLENARVTIPS
jgi:adenylate cyclase